MATSELEMTSTVDEDGTTVLHLAGEVDAWSAGRIQHEALGLLGAGKSLAVDVAGVTFLDSRGIGALLEVSRAGRTLLELRRVPARLVRVLDLSGKTAAFRVTPAVP